MISYDRSFSLMPDVFRLFSLISPAETSGLGVRWGPYRLDVGQKLVQVSEDSKKGLDEETKRKAQETPGPKMLFLSPFFRADPQWA